MHRPTFHLLAMLLLAAGCGRSGGPTVATDAGADPDAGEDPRCTLENCRLMFDCGLEFVATPDSRHCEQEAGPPPADFDRMQYCVATCNATNGGPLAQCIASNQSWCGAIRTDPSAWDSAPACLGFASTESATDEACEEQCLAERTACDERCPATAFKSCMDCAAQCGLASSLCLSGC